MDTSFFSVLVLIFIISTECRPEPQTRDVKAMTALFGSRLSSLLMEHPSPSEGSADGLLESPAEKREEWASAGTARFLADVLRRHAKMRRRGGKLTALGGRGCFGMKMDRIGAVSRLGC
ncbi:C-type natriuretic peptide 2 [Corythoichthys intestinalis]|uniref:C-type natriuretic peptide 2 n=1 Tax=Corythoichthys intestinalis TaxID=161448 RepID=UPI0025A5AF31|nr:C-type natriuretic peptide 2 [Corythoichthys intestinalis]XP_061810669.1 C-type natriuretic peptide 2-like [Nerophis lumbriciformis]